MPALRMRNACVEARAFACSPESKPRFNPSSREGSSGAVEAIQGGSGSDPLQVRLQRDASKYDTETNGEEV